MINDKARSLVLNGELWALGAVWSAADYDKRPNNLYKFTRDQGFEPEATLVAHLPEASQVGWYEFESVEARPSRAGCLAHRLFDQVGRRSREEFPLPSVVILNLGECAWLTVLDDAGRILSEFERWGDIASLRRHLQDDEVAGTVNSFRKNELFIDDEDEAITWLFEGYRGRPLYADRLYATSHNVKIGALVAGIAIIVSGGLYEYHVREVARRLAAQQEQAWLTHSRLLASNAAKAAAQKLKDERFNQRLQAYWANYPRPWSSAISSVAAASACESYVTTRPQNVDGWERTSASCYFNGQSMAVTESWKRGALATVLAMPVGAIPDGSGNAATDSTTVLLPLQHDTHIRASTLPAVAIVSGVWIAAGQSNPAAFTISAKGFTPFKPPVPGFVDQADIKNVEAETPTLWMQEDIGLQSGYAPSGGWPEMTEPGFTVQSITVSYKDNGINWQMTGVQYAQ